MDDLQVSDIKIMLDQQTKLKSMPCNLCHYASDLRKKYLFPVASRGTGRILVITDQPYSEEHKGGQPFSGAFGAVFDDYLYRYTGLSEKDCTFTCAVKCTSINELDLIPARTEEFKNCSRYLLQEIRMVDPILIIFIGKDSSKSLLENNVRRSHAMGTPFKEFILGKPRWCYFMTHPLSAKTSTGAVPQVRAYFRGLNKFISEHTTIYDQVKQPTLPIIAERSYELITTEQQLDDMYNAIKDSKFIAMDTETNSLKVWSNDFKLVGISLAATDNKGYYIPIAHSNKQSKRKFKQLKWETIVKPVLEKLSNSNTVQLIFHNLYYDYAVLKRNGLDIFKLDPANNLWTHDSLLMCYLEDENPAHGLKDQMFFKFGEKPQEFKDIIKGSNVKTFEYISPKKALIYAADDAINTLTLFHESAKIVFKESKLYTKNKLMNNIYPTELKVIKILADAHLKGICIDNIYLKELDKSSLEDLTEVKEIIYNISTAVTNFNSGTKLVAFLKSLLSKEFLKYFTEKYKEINAQEKTLILLTNQYKLWNSNHEQIAGKWNPKKLENYTRAIVKYKHVLKMRSTYIDAIENLKQEDQDGNWIIHANLNSIGTTSGRMSSNNPNLQNIPREIPTVPEECWHCKDLFTDNSYYTVDASLSRYTCSNCTKVTKNYMYDIRRLFIPRPGMKFIAADYIGMELYLAAAVSGDVNLYNVFKMKEKNPNDPNGDMHIVTAASILKITPNQWQQMYTLNSVTKQKAIKYRQLAKTVNYLVLYGGSAEGLQKTLASQGIEDPVEKCQEYLDGFDRAYPNIKTWFSKQKHEIITKGKLVNNYGRIRHVLKKGGEVLSAINMLIQGLGAQIIKESLVNIDTKWKDSIRYPLLVIHDENILEVPETELQAAVKDLYSIMEIEIKDMLIVKLKIDPIIGMNSLSKADKGIALES